MLARTLFRASFRAFSAPARSPCMHSTPWSAGEQRGDTGRGRAKNLDARRRRFPRSLARRRRPCHRRPRPPRSRRPGGGSPPGWPPAYRRCPPWQVPGARVLPPRAASCERRCRRRCRVGARCARRRDGHKRLWGRIMVLSAPQMPLPLCLSSGCLRCRVGAERHDRASGCGQLPPPAAGRRARGCGRPVI